MLWPIQPEKPMNNLFQHFILPLKKKSKCCLGVERGVCFMFCLRQLCRKNERESSVSLLLWVSKSMHPLFIVLLKVEVMYWVLHRDRCHEEILMPPIWELHYLKYFSSPGSFSVKQTPQLTAGLGALGVSSTTEAVGEKDENLSQNVKMAADLEASGLVLHPSQCPRKYNFTSNKFSPLGFFPLLPQSVCWKIWGQETL